MNEHRGTWVGTCPSCDESRKADDKMCCVECGTQLRDCIGAVSLAELVGKDTGIGSIDQDRVAIVVDGEGVCTFDKKFLPDVRRIVNAFDPESEYEAAWLVVSSVPRHFPTKEAAQECAEQINDHPDHDGSCSVVPIYFAAESP